MNARLPTNDYEGHFWAEPSRQLLSNIDITMSLYNALKSTKYAFDIDDYYYDLIIKCREFLSSSGGSLLPRNIPEIELYYTIPIFKSTLTITIDNTSNVFTFDLKLIGSASYANVYKYKDLFYNKTFVLKRVKKELTNKELLRFKREFEEMNEYSSPYILEVYCYNDNQNEYIMEYLDFTLDEYISKNNTTMSNPQRKGIGQQILKAFEYIHSKGRLHRDISSKNILIKKFDDALVVKIADFGLVKIPNSSLTTVNTEFKGYFNDISLIVDGFDTYNIFHKTYALTKVIYYVMTGKTNTDNISNQELQTFVNKGLNSDKSKRFKNVNEMIQSFHGL